jgi:citrate lyase subunit beta/citryl-CoA lyase
MTGRTSPVWRSLLYVPAHVEKFVASAHMRGADAIILDLEDSVPPAEKARARDALPAAVAAVGRDGADVLVRINATPDLAGIDIVAAVRAGAGGLSIPKAESAAQIRSFDEATAAAEALAGVEIGHTRFVLIIETAAGFLDMLAVARASPRTVAILLGAEDFALDLGMEPTDETLRVPRQQVVIVAAAAGVMPLGLIGGATRFDDPEGYRAAAIRSRRFGFVGSTCIHPDQAPILNEAFAASAEELAHARRVLSGAAEATGAGRGAFSLDGKMIDAPVVRRAEQVLARQSVIDGRTSRAG